MPKIDNKKFYTSALKLHGKTAKGLNWFSQESQFIRFSTIVKFLPNNLTDITIADAGCGFGDFYIYLQQNNNTPKNYIGIDSIKEMCQIASEQTKANIIYGDVLDATLPQADYYISSGALNTLTKAETFKFIQNCYQSSRKGFIFNILYGEKESKTYNYMSKEGIILVSKLLNVQNIHFFEKYLESDITVFLEK